MLYKMKAPNNFKGNAVEHTYQETVQVKNGIAICKSKLARDALHLRFYDFLEEIPVNLGNQRIPDIYYTEQSARTVEDVDIDFRPKKDIKLEKAKPSVKRNRKTIHKNSYSKKAKS